MPSLAELMGVAPKPQDASGVDAARPWDSPVLQAPPPQPMPTPAPPYQFQAPDPMAQAQKMQQQRDAMRQLTSPTSPVLEIPSDVKRAWDKVMTFLGRKPAQ